MATIEFVNDGNVTNLPSNIQLPNSAKGSDVIVFYDLISDTNFVFNVAGVSVEHTISPEWNETRTFGKMDPITTYKGTTRKLKVGFTINLNQRKTINTLAQLMYPSFLKSVQKDPATPAQQRFGLIFNVPIIKLYYSNGITNFSSPPNDDPETKNNADRYGLLGYITGFSIQSKEGGFTTPSILSSFQPGSGATIRNQKVSFDFTPLHESLLDRQDSNFRSNFIFSGAGDTKTGVNAELGKARLVNSKLEEVFQYAGSGIVFGPPDTPKIRPPEAPAPKTTPAPTLTPLLPPLIDNP